MSAVNKVMIIDDDEIHNYLFARRIKNVGLSDNVEAFTNGKAGLRCLEDHIKNCENLPDVIFLDLQMPSMDGWNFLEKLQKMLPQEILQSICVFMLSSSVFPRDIEKAKEHELIKDYIKKPLMEDELFVIKDRFFGS